MTTEDWTFLLLRARAGDDRALTELVRAAHPEVWRFCRWLSSASEADDLTQETFVQLFRSMHRFRGDASARTWLLSIARNVCADAVRRKQRQLRLVTRLECEPIDTEVHDGSAMLDLQLLVHRLDADRKEAFVLTQITGLSYEQAADVIGCPIGTVRSRVARARSDLVQLTGAEYRPRTSDSAGTESG